MIRTLLLAIAVVFTSLQAAHACSCAPPPPPIQALENSTAVFSGKVTSIAVTDFQKRVTIEVAKTWKGTEAGTVVVTTARESAACGNGYTVGQEWLVYAYGKEQLSTNLCTRSQPLQNAQEDLKELGPGKAAVAPSANNTSTTPSTSGNASGATTWLARAFVPVALAIFALKLMR
jgi:hypothetical protein